MPALDPDDGPNVKLDHRRAGFESADVYVRHLQRAVLDLILIAKAVGLNEHAKVNEAKELIRCRVLQCGMAGACTGRGVDPYVCPLRDIDIGDK